MLAKEPERKALQKHLMPAAEGRGPLLQRDYWGIIDRCRTSPSGVVEILRCNFCELAPPQLARFRTCKGEAPLAVGDELQVAIRGAGTFGVRVVHCDRQSFTLATLRGHPEAGRITFGAYRNLRGDVVFHIRSRARSATITRYFGFLAAGEPMQTSTWGELINRVAISVGEGIIGFVQAETRTVEDDGGDRACSGPTFRTTGD